MVHFGMRVLKLSGKALDLKKKTLLITILKKILLNSTAMIYTLYGRTKISN
jgi:hypothetical protein